MAEQRIYAFLKSFPRGINTDVDPLLLPPDQLAFSENATVRGDFISPRPNYFNLTLNDLTGGNVTTGLIQGAGYFRTQSNGYIMLSVAGKLFQIEISPDSKTATITEVILPSGNSPDAKQNWMRQAGPFLVWNDGINLPMFYDGGNARRSLGANPVPLGTTSSDFMVPAQNQYVSGNVPLLEAFKSSPGTVVLIGTALYNVVTVSGGSTGGRMNIILKSIKFTAGDIINPGTDIKLNNKYCGTILDATDDSLTSITDFPPLPVPGTTGTQLTMRVIGNSGAAAIAAGSTVYYASSYYSLISSSAVTFPSAPVAGQSNSVALNGFGGIGTPFTVPQCPGITTYFGQAALIKNGTQVSINGLLCNLSVSSDASHNITAITATPAGTAGAAVYAGGAIAFPAVTVCFSYNVAPCGCLGTTTIAGGSFNNTNNGLLYQPGTPNQFTLTLSKAFIGKVGDTLAIGWGTSTNVKVVAINASDSTVITCEMPAGYVAAGTVIPINGFVSDTTTFVGAVVSGTTQNNIAAIPAIGTTGYVVNINSTGPTLSNGQVVTIIGGSSAITGVLTNVASSGTIGANPNYFRLTLSIANTAVVGNALQVGSGNTLAKFVVTSVISASIVQCQMTQIPVVTLIPITSATPTQDQLVINNDATGATTQVGSYPTQDAAIPPNNLTAVTVTSQFSLNSVVPGTDTMEVLQIVEILTSTGATDIFQVVSVAGGSSGSNPAVTLQNINDIPSTTNDPNYVKSGTAIYSLPELPVSRMISYGMGRTWVALTDGVSYVGSDAIGSPTGTQAYDYQDAVLKVSQNYFLAGGGTFKVSGAGETIQAMEFVAQLDAALGQGPLQVFTNKTVFSNNAPTDMTTWSQLTSPIQSQGLIGSGGISQDAVVQENNDLIFRLSNGGVQSFRMARIDFNQWGNTPISREIRRLIENDNQAMLQFNVMTVYNNRLLMGCQPASSAQAGRTPPDRGIYHRALAVLNFDPITSLAGKQPSVWESQWTGLNVVKLVTGVFNGVEQCYAICLKEDLTGIEVNRILLDNEATLDNDAQPVDWNFETCMLPQEPESARRVREYKRLINGDFSVRGLSGDVNYAVFYRTDQNPNWTIWYASTIVWQGSADPGYRRRIPIGMPSPNVYDTTNKQPMREGYKFQLKFQFSGWCVPTDIRIACDVIPEPEFGRPT